jgi:hypothetical protein
VYQANLRGSNGSSTLDLTGTEQHYVTVRDYAFFRAGLNGAMTGLKLPAAGYFGNNAFVRNLGLQSVTIDGAGWAELTWNNFLYLDKPAGYSEGYGYSTLPPLWIRETADGGAGLGVGWVLPFYVPDTISMQRLNRGSDLLTNSEDDGNYFASQIIPTNAGNDSYRGQSSMTLSGTVATGLTSAQTVDVYSEPVNDITDAAEVAAKKIGTMAVAADGKGTITLSAPSMYYLDTLTPEKAMDITGNPTKFGTDAAEVAAGTIVKKGSGNLPGDYWYLSEGPYAGQSGYYWQPTISNQSGVPVNNAKALTVKDIYFAGAVTSHQEDAWKVSHIAGTAASAPSWNDGDKFVKDANGETGGWTGYGPNQTGAKKQDVMWYGGDRTSAGSALITFNAGAAGTTETDTATIAVGDYTGPTVSLADLRKALAAADTARYTNGDVVFGGTEGGTTTDKWYYNGNDNGIFIYMPGITDMVPDGNDNFDGLADSQYKFAVVKADGSKTGHWTISKSADNGATWTALTAAQLTVGGAEADDITKYRQSTLDPTYIIPPFCTDYISTNYLNTVAGGGTSTNAQIYYGPDWYRIDYDSTSTIVDAASNWKKATREGTDTYAIINHVVDNKYYTDTRKVYYVYVSRDVNLLRTAISSNETIADHDKNLGVTQSLYEMAPAQVQSIYSVSGADAAFLQNFHSVHLSLKAGWNQVEEKTTYPGDISFAAQYRGIKTHRISTGKQGPFSTYSTSNTSTWTANAGKAFYMPGINAAGTAEDVSRNFIERIFSDEGHEIPVPYTVSNAE